MAQHNYFGFTAPVTQYAPAQPSYAAPQQPAYVPAGQGYAAAPARPAAQYSGYDQGSHTAYAAYTPAAQPAPRPVVTVAVTPQYQAVQVKPTYSSGYGTPAARPVTNVVPTKPATNYGYVSNAAQQPAYSTPQPTVSTYTNNTPNPATSQANPPNSTYGKSHNQSYDAALYSAATNYYNQKQQTVNTVANTWTKKDGNPAFNNRKPGGAGRGSFPFGGGFKKKANPTPAQTHYCEVCKISCAGPQTYKEHLEGQKHKKKEAQQKSGNAPSNMRSGQSQLRCDLCDVTCTGTDAYTAHIRGAKHQKTLNLHQRLGKPIPSSDPTIVTAEAGGKTSETKANKADVVSKKVVVATPGIKFVSGTTLQSLGKDGKTTETLSPAPSTTTATTAAAVTADKTAVAVVTSAAEAEDDLLLPGEKAVQPIGQEYVEESYDNSGKLITFSCKLCDCKFNDPYAKNMHLKGRRHRANYKKKVDPSLVVDMKQTAKSKRIQQDREKYQSIKEMKRKLKQEEMAAISEIRMLESDRFMYQDQGMNENFSDRIETYNDRHIMAKHTAIYPAEEELLAIQNIVTACEKALKLVSDVMHEESGPAKKDAEGKEIRQMKGVMRVGDLAKGLILSNNLNVELVVLCTEKPTKVMLSKVHSLLPAKLKEVSEESFNVTMSIKDAAIVVTSTSAPATRCSLMLTSPLMRQDPNTEAPASTAEGEQTPAQPPAAQTTPAVNAADLLDKQKCLDALAALRHAKWFQARASVIPSCVLLLRVLKELRCREEKFACVPQWGLELLLERCMVTAVSPMGPGDALRRFFECLASGLVLPGGPGLSDPCEKEPIDVFGKLNLQSRENLTAYAQASLRMIAFNQITKILDIEALAPEDKPLNMAQARKRPFNSTDEEGADGKKEKTEAMKTEAV